MGNDAHRGWTRLLLYRRRGLIDLGPRATRSASGKTDEEEQQQRHDDHRYHYPEQFNSHAPDKARP